MAIFNIQRGFMVRSEGARISAISMGYRDILQHKLHFGSKNEETQP
jgi:hypothetical protein